MFCSDSCCRTYNLPPICPYTGNWKNTLAAALFEYVFDKTISSKHGRVAVPGKSIPHNSYRHDAGFFSNILTFS